MNEADIIATTYSDKCDIIRPTKSEVNNKTVFIEVALAHSIPCSLSQSGTAEVNQSPSFATATGQYKLFVRPDVDIQANDIIIVSQGVGVKHRLYAGKPARYLSHLEVPLNEKDVTI
ncbi:MAG: hypothetical protein RR846_07810 [Oscillospiraceae bacterium]